MSIGVQDQEVRKEMFIPVGEAKTEMVTREEAREVIGGDKVLLGKKEIGKEIVKENGKEKRSMLGMDEKSGSD